MKLLLERIYNCKDYCIGHLYDATNGKKVFICDTLEDTDRGFNDSMGVDYIKKLKVYGKTAIPTGTYNVNLNVVSPKFSKKQFYMDVCKGCLPRLEKVKGFESILVHCGNTSADSERMFACSEKTKLRAKLSIQRLLLKNL